MITTCHITDIRQLLAWRREVLSEVFGSEPSQELMEANLRYYDAHIPDNSHQAVVARYDGVDAGCGGVCFYDELPSPDNPAGACAYLMNIYVRPEFRRRGVAHAIVSRLIHEARTRGCDKIYLESTPIGMKLYQKFGFVPMENYFKLHE